MSNHQNQENKTTMREDEIDHSTNNILEKIMKKVGNFCSCSQEETNEN